MSLRKRFVKKLADLLGVQLSPVQQIHELRDDRDVMYVWQMDMTDAQLTDFSSRLKSAFVKKYGRDPEALHLVVNDVEGVKGLDPGVVREVVEPWLNNQGDE